MKLGALSLLEHGLIWAVVVWAATVGLMAYHLQDSPWRWAFAALSLGGLVTVWAIFGIRKYIDRLSKPPQGESRP